MNRFLFSLILILAPLVDARAQIMQQIMSQRAPAKTPVDSPGAGTYSSTQSVTITDPTAQRIMYTLTGTAPNCIGTSGTLYTGAFNISTTSTLKAIGCNGITGGGMLTSVYTISAGGGTLIQHNSCSGSTGGSGVLTCTVSSTGAGHVLVIGFDTNGTTATSAVCADGTSSYTTSSITGQPTEGICYTLSTASGKTSFTITGMAGFATGYAVWSEWSGLTGNLDTFTATFTNPTGSPFASSNITTMHTDLIVGVGVLSVSSSTCGGGTGYTVMDQIANGSGHVTCEVYYGSAGNSAAPAGTNAAQFTSTGGAVINHASAFAFY